MFGKAELSDVSVTLISNEKWVKTSENLKENMCQIGMVVN